MQISAGELASRLNGSVLRGDAGAVISGVASLTDAESHSVAPYTDDQYLAQLKSTRAGTIITSHRLSATEMPGQSVLLCCNDPEMAFLNAIKIFNPDPPRLKGVHPSAIVEAGVELGAEVYVGAHAHLESGVKIGARGVIANNVSIGRNCVIGDDCQIFPNAVLYSGVFAGHRVMIHSGAVIGADGFGYKFRGGKHVKVPQVGSVIIGDDVEIGANTCIDRGALGATRIGNGTKIDNLVQIGHNCDIGQHCIICGQAGLAGSCMLEDYVVLGGNVGLADHVKMGRGSKAGAKTGIAKDIPAGSEVWGFFADERNAAFKSYAALRRLPQLLERMRDLERTVKQLTEKNEC